MLRLNFKKWVHKQFSGIKESLRKQKEFICKICSTVAEADDLFQTCMTIDGDEFDTISKFCYLGGVIGLAGGCIDLVTTCIQSTWKVFHDF